MAPFRPLIAKAHIPTARSPILAGHPESRLLKQRRHHHTSVEWEDQKQVIIQLYAEQRKTAQEVIELLKSDFSFTTGRRQLYSKLKEWGIKKNNKQNEEETLGLSHDVEDDIIAIDPDETTHEMVGPSLETFLHGISFSPLTQDDGAYQSRQSTPVASLGVSAESSKSIPSRKDVTHSIQSLPSDSFPFGSIDFRTLKPCLDISTISPGPLAKRIALQSPRRARSTTGGTSQIRASSLLTRGRESTTREGSITFSCTPSCEATQVLVGGRSHKESGARTSLEQILSRVIESIGQKECIIGRPDAVELKEDIETLLNISQKLEQEPGNYISSFPRSRQASLSEGIGLAKNLIASSPSLALNSKNLDRLSKRMLRITWQQRYKMVDLGSATLNVSERVPGRFSRESHQLSDSDNTTCWYFSMKIIFKPKMSTRALKIELHQYQITSGSFSSIPRLSVNNIIPNDSLVFKVATSGSVQDLLKLFATGQASLRDYDQHGWSLLHHSLGNTAMCRFLVDSGLDIDETAGVSSGWSHTTPLHICYYHNASLEVWRILLSAGADPTVGVDGNTSILGFVCGDALPNNHDMLRLILDNSGHFGVVNSRDHLGRTLLLQACSVDPFKQYTRIDPERRIQLLLSRGSDIKDMCRNGSCLHVFFRSEIGPPSEESWLSALIYLVHQGADVYSTDDYGTTVSQIAYAEYVCYDFNYESSYLGSYRGDLWDAVLHSCGFDISDFRKHHPRKARYTVSYTRNDFEQLWAGREKLCPYWDDSAEPLDVEQNQALKSLESSRRTLCVCLFNRRTRWVYDNSGSESGCYVLGLMSDGGKSGYIEEQDESDLEIMKDGVEERDEEDEMDES